MMIDKMDYIFAIAREQNLTRAAKRLFVAQSTLTMYLNRVEQELGIKLFDRSKTPILPTPAGALCIEELKKIRQIGGQTDRPAPADGASGGNAERRHRSDARRGLDAVAAAAFS